MIGRYQKRILLIAELLRQLEQNPANLEALVSLQRALVRNIKSTEANISRVRQLERGAKARLRSGRLPRDESKVLRKEIARHKKRVADYQFLKFTWKCFGDGIAFIYLDKFALKPAYYDTADYSPKQDAGALSGKAGLEQEWAFVQILKGKEIPALLCDLTNTLRHGDVCVLVGPDPILIEVKSSKNANDRVERQVKSIKALNDFFEKDEARNFRGVPHVSRVTFGPPEVTHLDALGRCIGESEKLGAAKVTPEPGLHYFCLRETSDLDKLLTGSVNSDTIMCLVNEAKRDQSWPPYYPFTLSIRNPTHLYEFIRGDLTIAVVVDSAEMRRQFLSKGQEIVLSDDESWAIWMRGKDEPATSGISRQIFGRMFHEFQSLAWFVAVQSDYGRKIEATLKEQAAQVQSGSELPERGWIGEFPEYVDRLFDAAPKEPSHSASKTVTKPQKR